MENSLLWLSRRTLHVILLCLLIIGVWAWFYRIPEIYQARCKVVSTGDFQEYELFADAANVGLIEPGMSVLVKMDVFPYQKTGSVRGEVFEVGRMPVNADSQGGSLYLVRVKPTSIPSPIKGHLDQGMEGTAEIITGEHRLLNIVQFK